MTLEQFLGVTPWMAFSGVATWAWQAYLHRDSKQEKREVASAAVDMHRDDLALKLLSAATEEIQQARKEVEEVRSENKALRALETHFYHFQQALEHLEAILTAGDDLEARKVAERNASSFLARMRRLQQAKGTIQQEIQIVESAHRLDERDKE